MVEGVRVLVVDPDDEVAEECTSVFASHGWLVDRARTFDEALGLGKTWIYDVAIIELTLPDRAGTDAWSQLNSLQPQLCGIITTKSLSLYTSVQVLERNIVAYLLKPLQMGLLYSLVDETTKSAASQQATNGMARKLINLSALMSSLTQVEQPQELLSVACVNLPTIIRSDLLIASLGRADPPQEDWRVFSFLTPPRSLTEAQSEFVGRAIRACIDGQRQIRYGSAAAGAEDGVIPGDLGINNVAAVPLLSPRRSHGALAIVKMAESTGGFNLVDVELLTAIARVVALALDNAVLAREEIVDQATGAYSSSFLSHFVQVETKRRERFPRRFSMLHLGVEHAQTRGGGDQRLHGDELRTVVELARRRLRSTDFIARDSSERLTVMLAEADDAAALRVAARLKQSVEHDLSRLSGGQAQIDAFVVSDWDSVAPRGQVGVSS